MADFGVFIGFGFPVRGREEGATKVFGELLAYLGAQAGQGNVESFEPVFLQRKRAKERRCLCGGMDGRADVVPKPRQCEFGGAGATANSIAGLEDEYAMAGARQCDGRGKTVRSRSNNYGIVFIAHSMTRKRSRSFFQLKIAPSIASSDVPASSPPLRWPRARATRPEKCV